MVTFRHLPALLLTGFLITGMLHDVEGKDRPGLRSKKEQTKTPEAEDARLGSVPEGKVYTYGAASEIEVHFPEDHDAATKKVPGIIMFHGGAWRKGDRVQFRYLCHYFASRGLVAATVNYKLGGKSGCVKDGKSAIRWYKQHADELGIDPQRIITGGGSAGGHVCLLATTNPGLNDLNDPKGYDTSVAAYLLFNPALTGKEPAEVNFLRHLKADFPPAIVFFGTKDNWLKGWNPAYRKMKSLGVKSVDFWVAEGQSHSFFNKQPWKDRTIVAADQFLKKHGLIEGEPTLAAPKNGETLITGIP